MSLTYDQPGDVAEPVHVLLPMCPCSSAGECREKPENNDKPSLGFLVNGTDIKRCRVFALGEDAVFPSNSAGLVAYPVEKTRAESLPGVPVMTQLVKPGLSLTGNGTAWVPLTAAETTAATIEPCPGTEPLKAGQRANERGGWDNRERAQRVLARARCIQRHPGLDWYELAKHWGFKGTHAQTACEQLLQFGFVRMERGRRGRGGKPHRFYPA